MKFKRLMLINLIAGLLCSNRLPVLATTINQSLNEWTIIESTTANKGQSASAIVNEKIYIIGGYNDVNYFNTVEVYDPKTNEWDIKSNMPTTRRALTSVVIDNKIYCIGGRTNQSIDTGVLEVYDPLTDTWETKTSMPTTRSFFTSSVVDGKIYCIGGEHNGNTTNIVEVYDPTTDTWETKASMPTSRGYLTSSVIDGKIYCIGGNTTTSEPKFRSNILEVYNPVDNTWETKANMPTARSNLSSVAWKNKIYVIGGMTSNSHTNIVELYDANKNTWSSSGNICVERAYSNIERIDNTIYIIKGRNNSNNWLNSIEKYTIDEMLEESVNLVKNAEQLKTMDSIANARHLVNQLNESVYKEDLQKRLNQIYPNISLEKKTTTSNLDLYIKSENILMMSLNTNSITFEDFSGVEDRIKENAVQISINSSLPYSLNAYLPTEIQNSDKSVAMNKDILNIKENSETTYQTFLNTTDKIVLKDNNQAGNDLIHNIDIKLKGGIAHQKDVYKTTIKFEAEQK